MYKLQHVTFYTFRLKTLVIHTAHTLTSLKGARAQKIGLKSTYLKI